MFKALLTPPTTPDPLHSVIGPLCSSHMAFPLFCGTARLVPTSGPLLQLFSLSLMSPPKFSHGCPLLFVVFAQISSQKGPP